MNVKIKIKNILQEGSKKFLANAGWLVIDKVFHMVLSLVIMSVTARYLGTDNYGILNYGLSFVNIFVTVCKLGIDSVLVNEIVKNNNKTEEYVGTTIVLRMISGLLGILLTGLFVYILNPGNTTILIIAVIEGLSLFFNSLDTIDFYFQSKLESKYSAIAKSVGYVFVCILRLVLVVFKASVVWFAFATVVDSIAIAVGLIIFYKKENKKNINSFKSIFIFNCNTGKYLLKKGMPFILANMLVVIYTQMDKIMVGFLSTDSQVGIYTAAMNIANLWVFIPNAIIDSARPIIMQYSNEKSSNYMKRYVQLSRAICLMGIGAGIIFTLGSKLCVYILYGQKYMGAVEILMILIWSRLFSLLGVVRTIWLICENKQKYIKWFVGGGAVINVILNYMLIPNYNAIGAAIATLITEFIVAIMLPIIFKDTRKVVICIFSKKESSQ